MKRLLASIVLISALFAGSAIAQSAKFAAVYNDTIDPTFVLSEACATTDGSNYCGATGAADDNSVLSEFAAIKVPQAKELLVGLSAQVALGTYTEVRGKKGSYSIATAFAEGGVTLYACLDGDTNTCYEGKPGYVTLSNRKQELEAILGGVIESCDVELEVDETTASGSFSLSDCNVLDEMIALGITTMAAHHFNFLFPNLPQGDYHMIAKFETEAEATADTSCAYETDYPELCDSTLHPEIDEVDCADAGGFPVYDATPEYVGCQINDGSAIADAWAYIGKWMMTVQTVRAVKDDDSSGDFIDID